MLESTPLLPRGVYRARCLSSRGGIILFAVDHNSRLLPRELNGVVEVPPGDNPYPYHQRLWDSLELLDPILSVSDVA